MPLPLRTPKRTSPGTKKKHPEVEALRTLVSDVGLREAARMTGLHRESLTRMLAGLDVREGTRELVRKWERERKEKGGR